MTQERRERPTFRHQNCVIESISFITKVIFRPAPENPQRSEIMHLKDCPDMYMYMYMYINIYI